MTGFYSGSYDVIVIGAGHAGLEAALASARLGKRTLMIAIQLDSIALMACNPAIGGTSKGHIVREIDALGGEMGLAADATCLQMKTLNMRKGPAVRALRAQTDKKAYQAYMKHVAENTPNLDIAQQEAVQILTSGGRVSGILTALGCRYEARAIVAATGVYLKSKILIGEFEQEAGPSGLFPAAGLSASLAELGFELRRFKTGTPARVDGRSLDLTKTTPQYGDSFPEPFSFLHEDLVSDQLPCFLTYTTKKTHEVIRKNLSRSPLFSGRIEGVGPRYCPSIEDKVVRFPEKERHQMFLEPEGRNTNEIYVQGMSSSLPYDVQVELYRTVPGLEQAQFMRPAYAIEYDCIDPLSVSRSLQTKPVAGLFTAGQINGTSGYEEAAGQGIVAGINAARYIDEEPPVTLGRSDAYIGVLIDDLVTKGTSEPYRMMTARAEYRLLLRQDNAEERLTNLGRDVGLVSDERYDAFMRRMDILSEARRTVDSRRLSAEEVSRIFDEQKLTRRDATVLELLKRPEVCYRDISRVAADLPKLSRPMEQRLENAIKYEGYIRRQQAQVDAARRLENKVLPDDLDYEMISGLRLEARAKLAAHRPETVGQASRISGVSPADISVLLVYIAAYGHHSAADIPARAH